MNIAPVLIIAYNRPENLLRQIEVCTDENRPFLISIDGPKGSCDYGAYECASIARTISQQNSLSIGVRIVESNLGCRVGVSTAISWAFGFSDRLIILEDDVTVSANFFSFMDSFLEKFFLDNKIFLVNGWNPLDFSPSLNKAFYLSRTFSPWGWATWRNRWELLDLNLSSFSSDNDILELPTLKNYRLNFQFANLYKRKFEECIAGYDTWDYQFLYSMWLSGAFSIMPVCRLTGNVGFDQRATHTKSKLRYIDPSIYLPLDRPKLQVGEVFELINRKMCVALDHRIDFLNFNFRTEKTMSAQIYNLTRRILA